ncbi:MAG: PEP-utilizing enzyme [Parvibaculum sp.]|uniref:PEP-utilizing enzyme n=1 Tax=Parvibaculum sp. TaxID=2024848 RepID=UPI00284AD7D4|nr:PEP-utilizing enzyme [Parvibaculum sp.]MDR3499065.1 PEP-utilizing enzyme [Parvibaculum sp.]
MQVTSPPDMGIELSKAKNWNVLNEDPGRDVLWSRVNAAEAVPGVVTPLTAAFWKASNLLSMRRHVHRMGVLRAAEVFYPERPEDAPSGYFLGRVAGNIEFVRKLGDRLPGSSGDIIEKSIMGSLRPGVTSRKDRSRYPLIAFKLVWLLARLPREMHQHLDQTIAWWRSSVAALADSDYAHALRIFEEASNRRQLAVMDRQMIVAQLSPMAWSPLHKMGSSIGSEEDALAITSGLGGMVENEMLDELWRVAHGETDMSSFLARYGYMGPDGGELQSRSWREDIASLSATIRGYEGTPEAERPRARSAAAEAKFAEVEKRLLSKAGFSKQVQLRLAIWFCKRYLPLREVGKAAMFALSDVGRAAARRMGALLAGPAIEDPEDIFYLTPAELRSLASKTRNMRELVAERKALRAFYKQLDVPDVFTGKDIDAIWREIESRGSAKPLDKPVQADSAPNSTLRGVGVSKGIVRGRARVVLDPQRVTDFMRGDILVCHTTDPGWAPLFSIASAMVVDVGGMLSHSAIIARELGLPAVVNTRKGTRTIEDGSEITVDGSTGMVTIH